ncbi:unnamed protein product [Amoebophrya sp. A25]|nr:unnamed protein product [Amoebophrya sp. A25]|eukprot:GSA25T00014220001.1
MPLSSNKLGAFNASDAAARVGSSASASRGASAASSAAGGSPFEPRSPGSLGAERGAQMHASIGPVGLSGVMAQDVGVFPNLLSVELFVDTSAVAIDPPVIGGPDRCGSVFLSNVSDVVTSMFEQDQLFVPNYLISQPGNRVYGLQNSEFSKDMLDASTESVWIDAFFFLERGHLPRALLDAKAKLLRFESHETRPRYVRLLVQVSKRLCASSPRYFLSSSHPGLVVADPAKQDDAAARVAEQDIQPPGLDDVDFSELFANPSAGKTDTEGVAGGGTDSNSAGAGLHHNLRLNQQSGAFGISGMGSGAGSSPGPAVQLPGSIGSPLSFRQGAPVSPVFMRGSVAMQTEGGAAACSSAASSAGPVRMRDVDLKPANDGRDLPLPNFLGGASPVAASPQGVDPHVPDFSAMLTAEPIRRFNRLGGLDQGRSRSPSVDGGRFYADASRGSAYGGSSSSSGGSARPPASLVKNLLFGVSPWSFHGLEALQELARSLHPLPDKFFLYRKSLSRLRPKSGSQSPARSPTEGGGSSLFGGLQEPRSPPAGQNFPSADPSGGTSEGGHDQQQPRRSSSPGTFGGAMNKLAPPAPPVAFRPQPSGVTRGRVRLRAKWKKKIFSANELRVKARRRLDIALAWQDRACGLFDSWVYLLKHCLLELDTIIGVSDVGNSGANFAALQEMWGQWVLTMRVDVLESRTSVLPIFPEVQRACISSTIAHLDSFAIPTYDEDRLREWLRVATQCRSLLESLCLLAQNVWLHATATNKQPHWPHFAFGEDDPYRIPRVEELERS